MSEFLAQSFVVFKVTNIRMERFSLAVPIDQVVAVVSAIAQRVRFARASLRFRRDFGSGFTHMLTLMDRINWFMALPPVRVATFLAIMAYENDYIREKVLDFNIGFYFGSPVRITPGRIITTMVVMKVRCSALAANCSF